MKKIAVVGAGLIGKKHLKVIQSLPCVDNCALVDVTDEAKDIAGHYNIPFFSDLATMLDTIKPDGVIIATPNTMHMQGARACIERSIPVLVEKPFATDIDEAKAIVGLAESKNVPILTGYFRRYNAKVRQSKQVIEDGALGQLVSVHANFWCYKPDDGYFDVVWRTKIGGGPIQINLSHDIDLLLHFMGDIESVTAISNNAVRNFEVEDTAVVLCKFKNGALGTINISDTIVAPWSWEMTSGDNAEHPHTQSVYCMIGGTEASLELPNNRLWHYNGGHYNREGHWKTPISSTVFKTDLGDSLSTQIDHFCDVIGGTATPYVSGRDGLRVMQVTDAIVQSINTGQTVTLNQN